MKKCFVILIFVSLAAGCKKYVAGPQGDPGQPGKNGNSDLTSTTVFEIGSDAWDTIFPLDAPKWKTVKVLDILSKQALQSGDVKVYVQVDGTWFSLPYCEGSVFTQYQLKEDILTLYAQHVHGSIPPRPKSRSYRIVTITRKL